MGRTTVKPRAGTSLAEKLSGQVEPGVRERGFEYFHSGAVQMLDGGDKFVFASVIGTARYAVMLSAERGKLKVSCDCPYFDDRFEPCKHIWAAILAADSRRMLGDALRAPRLAIVPDEIDEDWNGGEDSADLRGGDEAELELEPLGEFEEDARRAPAVERRQKADWTQRLEEVRRALEARDVAERPRSRAACLFYVIDAPATTRMDEGLVVDVARRRRLRNGSWGRLQRAGMHDFGPYGTTDPADRVIMALLIGAQRYGFSERRFAIKEDVQPMLVELMCRTGRCALRRAPEDEDPALLEWDDAPWALSLDVEESPRHYTVTGSLRRGEERLPLAGALMMTGGLVLLPGRAARLDHFGAFEWVFLLDEEGSLKVPRDRGTQFLKRLLDHPRLPQLNLPDSLSFEQVQEAPRPRLVVRLARRDADRQQLEADLSFQYGGRVIAAGRRGRAEFDAAGRKLFLRDGRAEEEAAELLRETGFNDVPEWTQERGRVFRIAPRRLPEAVAALVQAGWHVEGQGRIYRGGGTMQLALSSGVDWFDLDARVTFDGQTAGLPELLAAVRRGERMVALGDGTLGLLPQEWLRQLGMLCDLGDARNGRIRFGRNQAGVLDALLAAQPDVSVDEAFARARQELSRFEGVQPAAAPRGFTGELRPYQRQGLGWLHFLRQFGFGGCLADDMGLGKTVQVLALLESRRALRAAADGAGERPGPSLVVVPRSLVFNWTQEAARFAPSLRVLDHTGIARARDDTALADHDVVVTTYGTLRRDVAMLKDVRFDYVILDESQAIKNAATQAAKAARLLQADHRLALSGTPIENHLGELWSLIEFLNPGLLGRGAIFKRADPRNPDEESRRLLAAALRPLVLRRTKGQVAADLPRKLEQTLSCDLLPAERRRYAELRDHYRRSVLQRVDRQGLNAAKMHVLEALLRLRQASCHPGLIDAARSGEPSAKLELLLPQLQDVIAEGHKALVFSQFTSLLSIVRDRLDRQGAAYEYLDGRTRDRGSRVDRFQNDPQCRLFLISLKAGGLGLNLTAAEYVFLLDPWWNPAVEAQAIDRAHRIGQTRRVFAYRLIARDTVEEKVLQLQEGKRALAEAIISADANLIRALTREDLERLLS